MDKTNKIVYMSNGEKMIIPKLAQCFTLAERYHIIEEFLAGTCTKKQLWLKYTGKSDYGRLLEWMRKLGYIDALINQEQEEAKFVEQIPTMEQEQTALSQLADLAPDTKLEGQQAKITKLEKQLQLARHKVGIAKRELGLTKKELEQRISSFHRFIWDISKDLIISYTCLLCKFKYH